LNHTFYEKTSLPFSPLLSTGPEYLLTCFPPFSKPLFFLRMFLRFDPTIAFPQLDRPLEIFFRTELPKPRMHCTTTFLPGFHGAPELTFFFPYSPPHRPLGNFLPCPRARALRSPFTPGLVAHFLPFIVFPGRSGLVKGFDLSSRGASFLFSCHVPGTYPPSLSSKVSPQLERFFPDPLLASFFWCF